jgi:hypothetical protein
MNLEENQGPSVDNDFAQLLSDNEQKSNATKVGRIETFNRANSLKFLTNKHSKKSSIKATEIITSLTNTDVNITSDDRFQIFSGVNVHRSILPEYPIGICKKKPKKRVRKVDFDYPIGVCKKKPKKRVRKVDFDYPIGICKKKPKKRLRKVDFEYPIGVCKKRPKKRVRKVDFEYPIGVCKKKPKKRVRKVDFEYPIGVCKKKAKEKSAQSGL